MTAVVAALYFGGNFEYARAVLAAPCYAPHMLNRSQFNRRLHGLRELLLVVFRVRGETFKQWNAASQYIRDSFPVAACDYSRIQREKRFSREKFRGYTASKRRYFFGVKGFSC